jgi:hypothetical protein
MGKMEDVLAVYTRRRDPDCPLVCLDEALKQLITETRLPVPMKEGQTARLDYEYKRNGTANLFMMFAPLEGWRHVKVTDRRTAVDYAHALKDISDIHFPNAPKIGLAQDNLNSHVKASLHEAFPAAEARRLGERFDGTILPSTAVGSTWPSPNWGYSLHNVSTAAFRTSKPSSTKPPPGKPSETATIPKPAGDSPPITPASNSNTSTLQFE